MKKRLMSACRFLKKYALNSLYYGGTHSDDVRLEHKHTGEFIEVAKLPGKKMPQLFLGSRYSCNEQAAKRRTKARKI